MKIWKDILKENNIEYKALDVYFPYFYENRPKLWKRKVRLIKGNDMDVEMTKIKLVISGNSGVGKSCLQSRLFVLFSFSNFRMMNLMNLIFLQLELTF